MFGGVFICFTTFDETEKIIEVIRLKQHSTNYIYDHGSHFACLYEHKSQWSKIAHVKWMVDCDSSINQNMICTQCGEINDNLPNLDTLEYCHPIAK